MKHDDSCQELWHFFLINFIFLSPFRSHNAGIRKKRMMKMRVLRRIGILSGISTLQRWEPDVPHSSNKLIHKREVSTLPKTGKTTSGRLVSHFLSTVALVALVLIIPVIPFLTFMLWDCLIIKCFLVLNALLWP